ncbi:MAG TPA: LiaF domain-containing protein [Polyangiaceae bacterium]
METRTEEAQGSTAIDVPFEHRTGASYADVFADDEEKGARSVSTDEDRFDRTATLDGLRIRVSSQKFRHGRITAMLSGVTVDLRDAALAPEGATIEVQSTLSGIDIQVPRDWDVVCDAQAVCAGIDGDHRPSRPNDKRPRLRITGSVVAGGLSVR